jgi:hypothetical protein
MQVKYQCGCVTNTNEMKTLEIRCLTHNQAITDWGSDYKSDYRVVIHWEDGKAQFALHKVFYDEKGFAQAEKEPTTAIYPTTVELAKEARKMGMSMEEVSNIFYDRYLEGQELFSK